MKKNVLMLVIGLGFYVMLLSTSALFKISVNEKEVASGNVYMLDYLKQKHLKEKPNCDFNKETCIKEFAAKMETSRMSCSIALSVGILMFTSGIILFYYCRKNKHLKFRSIRSGILFGAAEVFLNLIYWFMIGLLYFVMQMIIKKEVSGCVVDSMFIFYASGLTGFYIAYFYFTDKFLKDKKIIKWLVGSFVAIILGFILAYVVPYFQMLISTPNSLANPAFLAGFLYLAFFVFANIIVGTIFKGFFNWIKIVYSLEIDPVLADI